MKALLFYDRRDIRLEDVDKPSPAEGEVLVKVVQAGISQTQINEFMEGPFLLNRKPHPLTGKSLPLIPGQEYGGVIEEVGKGVSEELVGKMVAVLPLVSCGVCSYCREGRENLCKKMAYHGLVGLDGGFAEYSVVKRENIFEVEREELLTFVEPLLVGIHSLNLFLSKGIEEAEGLKVLVLGAGGVGLAIASVWRDFAGADVFVNDILVQRLERAKRAGFDVLKKEELKRDSFDVVIDAAGMDPFSVQAAITEGFKYLKRGKFLINIGTYFHSVSCTPSRLLLQEKSLITSLTYTSSDVKLLPQVISKVEADFGSLIEEVPLINIIEEGYYRAEVAKESFVRLVVRC
jgi:(R,R)-butanediol dehydrogenase/meso-butanediol dehydrogenase/diacetyl reductase